MTIECRERIENRSELGIFEETAPLKKVIMWGTPGTEAVLGQLLPKKTSCFESGFKVLEAREEFKIAKDLLQNDGVEVILMKDLLAQKIKEEGILPTKSLDELKEELKERGLYFYNKYKDQNISKLNVLDWIDPILEEDKKTYGEEVAISINQILSLDIREELEGDSKLLPLANVVYARDQSNLLGQTWVWSSMEHDIRREEVKLYRKIIDYSGILKNSNIKEFQVSGKARFEGGDGIIHDGICYIGCGGRTNLRGILQVAPAILSQGLRLMAVYDGKRVRKEEPEMDAMHLDTFWMPCDKNEIVGCLKEIKRRKLFEFKMIDQELKIIRGGKFEDYHKDKNIKIIKLTKKEQEKYAPNFINLGNDKIILSLTKGNKLASKLKKEGIETKDADLENITKGYGGLHCMTAAIKRG